MYITLFCIFHYIVEGIDYVGQSANLAFARGNSRICHAVNIIQDDFCEFPEPEDFFASMAYVSGIQNINIIRNRTRVLIDDSNEPECGELPTEVVSSSTLSFKRVCYSTLLHCIFLLGFLFLGTCIALAIYVSYVLYMNYYRQKGLRYDRVTVCITPSYTVHYVTANCCADIRVGYERTVYTTSEGEGFVRLCAIIYSPDSGVAPRPFTISYTTADDTAGMHTF